MTIAEAAKKLGKEVYGMVMPLVTDSNGVKFGKTEGNALWLDKNKTSSYELYQYLINLEDSMIIEYLKKLTFLTKEEIEEIEAKHNENPHLREAHTALAREVITDLHGKEAFESALRISKALFGGSVKELNKEELENYINRLSQLEEVGNNIEGVDKAYALQAGRELRVIVKPEEVDDMEVHKIAREVKEKIEKIRASQEAEK